MNDSDDPLDLFSDDGDGIVELSFIEEEEKCQRSGGCVVFLLLGSSLLIAGWCMNRGYNWLQHHGNPEIL